MEYERTVRAEVVRRPNRFVAAVVLDGDEILVHVKNTGRCREILVPGATVILSDSGNPDRKYRYDLVAVYKGDLLVNIDSQAPNRAFASYARGSGIFGKSPEVHQERTHGDSRFDFYVESDGRRIFAEVKGVTLENDGVCMFPDAPTERGTKHVRGLVDCVREGFDAYVVFVVQMCGMRYFTPNRETDPVFSDALKEAERGGVRIVCLECSVSENGMEIIGTIPYRMDRGHSYSTSFLTVPLGSIS